MKRQELRDAVASSTGLTRRQVDDYIMVLAEIVAERFAEGERVELTRLGYLRLRNRQKWLDGKQAPDIVLTAPRWNKPPAGGDTEQPEPGPGDAPPDIEPEPDDPLYSA